MCYTGTYLTRGQIILHHLIFACLHRLREDSKLTTTVRRMKTNRKLQNLEFIHSVLAMDVQQTFQQE